MATNRSRCFVACVALILLLAGIVLLVTRSHFPAKQPLFLKSPLAQLSKDRLYPYSLLRPAEIQPDVLALLKANEYIHWVIHDPSPGTPDLATLVTYHSDSLDEALRMPMGDYIGFPRLVRQTDESVTITGRAGELQVPFEVAEYEQSNGTRCIVVRVFYANGRFCLGRAEVRRTIESPAKHCAYFSRVEVTMYLGAQTAKERVIQSMKRFLQTLLPVLLENHWPD